MGGAAQNESVGGSTDIQMDHETESNDSGAHLAFSFPRFIQSDTLTHGVDIRCSLLR